MQYVLFIMHGSGSLVFTYFALQYPYNLPSTYTAYHLIKLLVVKLVIMSFLHNLMDLSENQKTIGQISRGKKYYKFSAGSENVNNFTNTPDILPAVSHT